MVIVEKNVKLETFVTRKIHDSFLTNLNCVLFYFKTLAFLKSEGSGQIHQSSFFVRTNARRTTRLKLVKK